MFAVSTQCNDTQHIFVVNYSYFFFAKFIVAVLKNWLQFVFSPLLLQFSCVGFQNFAFIFFTFAFFTFNFYLLIYLLYVFAFIALQYAWSTTLALCIAQSKATCNHIVAVTTATSSWQLSPFTRNNNSRVGGGEAAHNNNENVSANNSSNSNKQCQRVAACISVAR